MCSKNLQKLILANEKTYDDYYSIRSEEKNLFWTGYKNAPDYNAFKNWFINRLDDPKRDIYLFYLNKKCAGALHIDYYDDYAAIGYNVKESFEGIGVGTKIVQESIDIISQKNNIKKIIAWINENNTVSERVITKNNFRKSTISEYRKRFGKEELYFQYQLTI